MRRRSFRAAAAVAVAFAALALVGPARAGGPTVKDRSESVLRIMHANADTVRHILSEARKRNDRGASKCADEALSRANTAVRLAKDRALAAQTAAAADDGDEVARQLRLLDELYVEQARVTREARTCLAPPRTNAPASTTSVRADVDPTLPPGRVAIPAPPKR
jgi:hypothetical protein